jgi:hypothetical protein
MVYYYNSIIDEWVLVDFENAYDLFKYEDICLKMIDMTEEDVKVWIVWINGVAIGLNDDDYKKFQNFSRNDNDAVKRLAAGEKFTFSNHQFIFIRDKIAELETDLAYYKELDDEDI